MKTKVITINDREQIEGSQLGEAARILRNDGLVVFPMETVYGLEVSAPDGEAAKRIYEAKRRPSDDPLITHVARREDMERLVSRTPEAGQRLMDAYWSGPLTLVFPESGIVPYGTAGGLETVTIRMPGDTIANHLIILAGAPIATPSASTSGRSSPTMAEHVYQDMNGKIEIIVDGGPVKIGPESTIVDVSEGAPSILRPGVVTIGMLKETLGMMEISPAVTSPSKADVRPKAPGMKYRHYTLKAELTLAGSSKEMDRQKQVAKRIMELAKRKLETGYRVGIIRTDESREYYTEGIVGSLGLRAKEEAIAHNLFAVLWECDDSAMNYILSESSSKEALGQAIMNRSIKAAGYHVLELQS